MSKPYHGLRRTFSRYWSAYGGWPAFLTSAYLHLSILLTFLLYWIAPEKTANISYWAELTLTISPSLLGFVLAGTAVFLGMGDQRFIDCIRGKEPEDQEESPFLVVVASFTHFTLFQSFALLNAVIAKALHPSNCVYQVMSVWLFLYSILLPIAAILAVFKLAEWYDAMPKEQYNHEKERERGE